MGKIRSEDSSGSLNDSRRARSKKKDSSGTTSISAAVREKFAWILQKTPIVRCEKLDDSKLPPVLKTFSPLTSTITKNESDPSILSSSQKNSKRTKDSSRSKRTKDSSRSKSTKDYISSKVSGPKKLTLTLTQSNESIKIVTPDVPWKTISLQPIHKRSKITNSASHVTSVASTSQERINNKASVSGIIATTEGGSSKEELKEVLRKSLENFERSKIAPNICTTDPNRISPCYNKCCFKGYKDESRKKKSKKRENESSASKRGKSSQANKAVSSQSKKVDSKQKTVTSPAQKRTKDRKPRTKSNEFEKITGKKVALFTPKNSSEDGSSSPFLSIRSPQMSTGSQTPTVSQIPTIRKCVEVGSTSKFQRYLIQPNSIEHPRSGIVFSLPTSSNANPNTPRFSHSQQGKATLFSNPTRSYFDASISPSQVLTKRTKPKDYFPGLNVGGTCVSETKTTHPKACVNTQSQNQMLEGATFPKASNASHSNYQSSFQKYQQNYNSNSMLHISPLSCEENETNVRPQTNFGKNRFHNTYTSNGIENQSLNQANGTQFLKNSVSRFSNNKATNDNEYIQKDRFRNSAVGISGTTGGRLEINEPTIGRDLLFSKDESLLGNQISYLDCLQEPLPAPMENSGEDPFDFEFSNDSQKMDEINSHVAQHIIPDILQSAKPKIMKCETLPSDFIQLLPRSQTSVKNENLTFEESGRKSQILYNEHSADDQKIAILKINNTGQLQKNDLQDSQKSDEIMSGDNSVNLGLTATQASDMLTSNLGPDLDNVGLDFLNVDLFGDDMVNNNEKMLLHSNGNINQPVEIKESKTFLDSEFENNNEMVTETNEGIHISNPVEAIEQELSLNVVNGSEVIKGTECTEGPLPHIMNLFNENLRPSGKQKKSQNTVNNSLSDCEETTYTASNLEELNSVAGTSEIIEGFPNFKGSDWNSPNFASEGVNRHFGFSSNHRKRRWFDDKQAVEQSGEKKVKLKRRKWNHCANEGEYTDTSSEMSSSCKSSLHDSEHKVFNYTEICDDNRNDLQIYREESGVGDSVVQNDSVHVSLANLLVMGEQKNFKKEEHKVEAVVEMKLEAKVQPVLETKDQARLERTKVQARVETKEIFRESAPVKESLVDPEPEPEPERGDSDSQPRKVRKAKNSPVRRKKRRAGYRSKFSPSNYSNSSSETSDDEFTKKNSSSSEDELESKDRLLKARLQRELEDLQDFQEMSENSNSRIVDTPITGEDEQDGQDVQDDILSVIASPSLMLMDVATSSRCPSPMLLPKTDQSSDYSDNTGDSYFDAFHRKNQEECNRDLRSLLNTKQGHDVVDGIFARPFPPLNKVKNQNQSLPHSGKKLIVFDQVATTSRPPVNRIFVGVCHRFLTTGVCTRKLCPFENQIPGRLQIKDYTKQEEVFERMRHGIKASFKFFVQEIYKKALKRLSYDLCLRFFTEVCNANYLSEQMLSETVETLWQKQGPIGKVVRDIAEQPIEPTIALEYFSRLLIIVAPNAPKNDYWETLHPLIEKVNFPPYMLEQILNQCIHDRGNEPRIEAVYEHFVRTERYQAVRTDTWITFCKLRGELEDKRMKDIAGTSDVEFYNNEQNFANQGIASPDAGADFRSPTYYHNGDDNVDMDLCSVVTYESGNSYKLMPIEDLAPPQSNMRGRDKFWKFYDHLESLRNGLKHEDYQHVVSILKQYVSAERTLFTRHCHKVLATEVNKSQAHMENTIKIAVQTGELFELRDILYRLGTCVLINLADQGLWVHAYELLKTLQTYNLHKNNAGFTLLAAEICLANHRYLKALTLLKQNDIIFTNCKKWKVASDPGDVHLRTSTVTLLLESLCQDFAEKAFFIFDLILGEQPSNSCPVDLTRVVDKLMLSLITQNHVDLVMNLCKKAMRYHLNFHETTFRCVITVLVPNDLVLARQFYQYATQLGVYSPIKVHNPLTRVIINVDWSEEEMYIVVLEFLRKMFLNIGFAASHLGPNTLIVFFVFELVPERKQLYHEHPDFKRDENQRVNKSKSMMREMLEKRFDPPIRFVKKESGRICKINSRSLVDYLKAGHIAA